MLKYDSKLYRRLRIVIGIVVVLLLAIFLFYPDKVVGDTAIVILMAFNTIMFGFLAKLLKGEMRALYSAIAVFWLLSALGRINELFFHIPVSPEVTLLGLTMLPVAFVVFALLYDYRTRKAQQKSQAEAKLKEQPPHG